MIRTVKPKKQYSTSVLKKKKYFASYSRKRDLLKQCSLLSMAKYNQDSGGYAEFSKFGASKEK